MSQTLTVRSQPDGSLRCLHYVANAGNLAGGQGGTGPQYGQKNYMTEMMFDELAKYREQVNPADARSCRS